MVKPKTPQPISRREFEASLEEYDMNGNGRSGLWKQAAIALGSLLIGMTAAWFTALLERGVSRADMEHYVDVSQTTQEKAILNEIPKALTPEEMHEYVDKYSPWAFDRQAIINRMSQQDEKIGELRNKIDTAADIIKAQHGAKP